MPETAITVSPGDYMTGSLLSHWQALGFVAGGAAVGAGVGYTKEATAKGAVIGAIGGLGAHVLASYIIGTVRAAR